MVSEPLPSINGPGLSDRFRLLNRLLHVHECDTPMSSQRHYYELRCSACSWAEVCGRQSVSAWLQKARKVRPGREPEWEILVELLLATAPQLPCPQCGRIGLTAEPASDDGADWGEPAACSSCGSPIPQERLQAIPGTTLCATCQRDDELGATTTQEYCPRCGAAMELRLSKSRGITRYVLACAGNPPCRR